MAALAWLEAHGSARNREGMARYGIRAPKVFGVSMAAMRPLARRLGTNHELALALWASGWLEARLLAAFVDDPARVTSRQMEQWARDFDNWAVCDSVCLHLFSAAPPRWRKAAVWIDRPAEFVRRAGCALLAALAVRDKAAADAQFLACLPALERIAADPRPLVKKGVSWALRQIGKRNPALNRAAIAATERLRASDAPAARWVGRDAARELTAPATQARIGLRGERLRAERLRREQGRGLRRFRR